MEWDVRFGNGRESMADMRRDIADLKPKTPDWMKLLGMVITLVVMIVGLQTWLQDKLNDRPTNVHVEELLREHIDEGHTATFKDINALRETLIVQGEAIKTLTKRLDDAAQKLANPKPRGPKR